MTNDEFRILLTGCNGQLGWELIKPLARLGRLCLVDIAPPPEQTGHEFRACDFSNGQSLQSLVQEIKPRLIVNSAGYTAVDRAESEESLAMAINSEVPGILSAEARRLDATLVHFSTDYVFDGSGSGFRNEKAETGPLGAYGRSKLAGDTAVTESGCRHLLLRTSWVFSDHGHNFVKTMLRLGKEHLELRIVDDQVGSPTAAYVLAQMALAALGPTADTLTARIDEVGGLYNITCSETTSWYGFACELFRQAKERGYQGKVEKLVPIPSAEYPTPAKRPLNSRLDCSFFQQTFAVSIPTWKTALATVMDKLMVE